MAHKKKIVAAGGIAGLLVAFAGMIMFAKPLCACVSLEENLQFSIGASPLLDPDGFRSSLLQKLPPGSALNDIYLALGAGAIGLQNVMDVYPEDRDSFVQSTARRCVGGARNIECRFVLEMQWWGLQQKGFDLHLALNEAGRLADARVSPYSVWGSPAPLAARKY